MKDIIGDGAECKLKGQERGQIKGIHCEKVMVFPSPDGMSLTKLSLAGNYLIIPGQGDII